MRNGNKYSFLYDYHRTELLVIITITTMIMLIEDSTLIADTEIDKNYSGTLLASKKMQEIKTSSIDHDHIENESMVNPHWDKNSCDTCHTNTPSKKNKNLRKGSDKVMCLDCHEKDIIHKYIHPVGIHLSIKKINQMKNSWKGGLRLDANNNFTCLTCHDLLNQCLSGRSYMQQSNPNFLRQGPYGKRTDICYKCHDSKKYKKLNPHDQIAKDGTLKKNKCRLCHLVKSGDRVKKGIERNMRDYPIIKSLDTDRTLLCIRCHKKIDHPTSAFKVVSMNKYRHFIPITDEKKTTLKEVEKETGVLLPLEPGSDRIYCGTCHEPHEPGVFASDDITLTKNLSNRLRVGNICKHCHDK